MAEDPIQDSSSLETFVKWPPSSFFMSGKAGDVHAKTVPSANIPKHTRNQIHNFNKFSKRKAYIFCKNSKKKQPIVEANVWLNLDLKSAIIFPYQNLNAFVAQVLILIIFL